MEKSVTRRKNSTFYVFLTSTAERFDNGLIVAGENPEWQEPDTPETSKDAALALQSVVGDEICGILYLPTGKTYYNKEAVKAFLSVDIGHKAEAMVVESFGARLLASVIVKLSKSPIPKKVFSNREDAEKWIQPQILKAKLEARKKK